PAAGERRQGMLRQHPGKRRAQGQEMRRDGGQKPVGRIRFIREVRRIERRPAGQGEPAAVQLDVALAAQRALPRRCRTQQVRRRADLRRLDRARELLARPVEPAEIRTPPRLLRPAAPREGSLRSQSYVELDRRWFALTRRTALDSADLSDEANPSNRFLTSVAPHLLALSAALPRVLAEHPLPALPGSR